MPQGKWRELIKEKVHMKENIKGNLRIYGKGVAEPKSTENFPGTDNPTRMSNL